MINSSKADHGINGADSRFAFGGVGQVVRGWILRALHVWLCRDPAHAKYKGFFHGVKTIVAEERLGGIYRGLGATVAKVATAQATRFGVFTVIGTKVKLDSPMKSAAAGAFAGGISVVLFQVGR